AREQLRGSGVSGGVVSTGSSVLVYGAKPGGAAFDIGIRDPLGGPNDLLGVLRIENGVISTSGGYEKYFEADGTRYHHIFDGKTGYPSDSGLLSVSVFCESGLLSDGLSTACYVLGYERSLELLKQYNAEAVFVLEDKTVRITVGLRQYFTLENSAYAVV
ncbi:MAG: FAD:protein FMN transferase, partial [Oscillospiraceae bacterium]|nr:FAD:protein FMN transferase [Oscillospiraceae bacterium]